MGRSRPVECQFLFIRRPLIVTYNQVDASNLVHELHAIGKQDSSSSLHLVTLEDISPLVLPANS
jgi:hypothetical protein